MAAIIYKSKEKVPNLDAIEGQDAYVEAQLKRFDILDYSYQINYVALLERTDEDNNPITQAKIIKVSYGRFSPAEIQALFDATGKDIAVGENFDTEMRDIIATALVYKIVQDGRFGLTANDWVLQ